MNLRELVAVLDCLKPEASESEVLIDDPIGPCMRVTGVTHDPKEDTAWLTVADY